MITNIQYFRETPFKDKLILSIIIFVFLIIFLLIGKWTGKKILNTTIKTTTFYALFITATLLFIFIENRIIALPVFNAIIGFAVGFKLKNKIKNN